MKIVTFTGNEMDQAIAAEEAAVQANKWLGEHRVEVLFMSATTTAILDTVGEPPALWHWHTITLAYRARAGEPHWAEQALHEAETTIRAMSDDIGKLYSGQRAAGTPATNRSNHVHR